jgi:hypothetical protein
VDYCSAASLLVRRTTWESVGGFDEGYFPGYYEDVDLCLAIARHGQSIVYEPRSRARHFESASLDWGSAYKDFVAARSHRRFIEKWGPELEARPPVPTTNRAFDHALHRAAGIHCRMLVIDDDINSATGAGSVLLEGIRDLAASGWAVSVLSSSVDNRHLQDAGATCITDTLSTHLSELPLPYDVVMVAEPVLGAVAPAIRLRQPQAALIAVLDRASRSNGAGTTWADARLSFPDGGTAHLGDRNAVPLIRLADRREGWSTPGFAERPAVVFLGPWTAATAVPRSLEWFVDRVLPSIRGACPWIRVVVPDAPVGAKDPASPWVSIADAGTDREWLYDHVRVAVAPSLDGTTSLPAVVSALRAGVPVVATARAVAGIRQTLAGAILIADEPEAFADRVQRLITTRRAWETRRAAIGAVVNRLPSASGCSWSELLDTARRERLAGSSSTA